MRAEHDVEQHVRKGEEALDRQALRPDEKRPLTERWWWVGLVTAGLWFRLLDMVLGGRPMDTADLLISSALLAATMVAFAWGRRRGERRRRRLQPGE